MNTVQNYVGKGDNATQPTQMAQNEAQTPLVADNRTAPNCHFIDLRLPLKKGGYGKEFSEAEVVYNALKYYRDFITNTEGVSVEEDQNFLVSQIDELTYTLVTEMFDRLDWSVTLCDSIAE